MPRYARIFASIWSDRDFVALTANAQRLYLLLVTQPDVSHCGLLPFTERRWASLAADTDLDSIRAALVETVDNSFVVVDEATQEILIRSYLKWDGQHLSPNGCKAIEKARSQVMSPALGKVIDDTLSALHEGATQGGAEGATQGGASPRDLKPRSATLTEAPPPKSRAQRPVGADRPGGTDLEANNARSAARAHIRVGKSPAEAYTEAINSYPRQHDAICAELGWKPE